MVGQLCAGLGECRVKARKQLLKNRTPLGQQNMLVVGLWDAFAVGGACCGEGVAFDEHDLLEQVRQHPGCDHSCDAGPDHDGAPMRVAGGRLLTWHAGAF